jgi:hypothetical protein
VTGLIEQMRTYFRGLQPGQRILIVAAVVVSALALVGVGWWSWSAQYEVVYSSSNPGEVEDVAKTFEEQGIPYRIAESGRSVEVLDQDLGRARIAAASSGKILGFEVLDVFTEWGRNMWEESILVMRKPVWLLENRQRFASRLAYQRAVSANDSSPTDAPNSAATTTESEPPAPSPLQIVVGGILTERLEQLRLQALERRAQRVNASLPSWRRAIPLRLRKKVANVLMPPPPNPWDFD